MRYQDNHLHYTGSLPIDFVWRKLIEQLNLFTNGGLLEDLFSIELTEGLKKGANLDDLFLRFKNEIEQMLRIDDDYTQNYEHFFKLYQLFQSVTKPKGSKDIRSSYQAGMAAIISELVKTEVSSFDIFAGPLLDAAKTKSRILGMIQGIQDNKHLIDGSVRLTFISSGDGYVNLNEQSLASLLELIANNRLIAKYVSGFDFSGRESVKNLDTISSVASQISSYNNTLASPNDRRLKVSVHAGEDLNDISPADYLRYFDQLLDLPINSIGHGIFLWIPDELVHYSPNMNRSRRKLLEKMAENGIELELCPTSNAVFSPLTSLEAIPIHQFKEIGLKYSINTDNMSILTTNIKAENSIERLTDDDKFHTVEA